MRRSLTRFIRFTPPGYLPPDVIVVDPRRWGWFRSPLDTNNRALFLPAANGVFNAAGLLERVDSQR